MADRFDPYHRWLGIPPHEQPPNYYRLLGLAIYESDPNVIESSADRQMAHVRSHQAGTHAEHVQQLLNEIAAARLCLLDVKQKGEYDARLKNSVSPKESNRFAESQLTQPQPAAEPLKSSDSPALVDAKPSLSPTNMQRAKPAALGGLAPLAVALIGGGLLIALLVMGLGGLLLFGFRSAAPGTRTPIAVADFPADTIDVPDAVDSDDLNDSTTPTETEQRPSVVPPPLSVPLPSEKRQPTEPPATDPPQETTQPDISPEDEQPTESPAHIAALFPPEESDHRIEIPDEDVQDQRRLEIGELFPIDEARTPQQKSELAQRLLNTGSETKGDHAGRFVLLGLARNVASDAGDVKLAFAAIDAINASFQADSDSLRIATIQQAAESPLPADARKEVLARGIEVVDGLIARDRYVDAAGLIRSLFALARRQRDADSLAALRDRQQKGSQLYEGYQAAQQSLAVLKENHGDANAALAVGKFYALAKGDWQLGLPLLAAGSDAGLKQLAEREMANPTALADCRQLADAWYEHAQSAEGIEADRQRARARMWYARIEGQLTGLTKIAAQRRIDELATIDLDGGQPYQAPPLTSTIAVGSAPDKPTTGTKPTGEVINGFEGIQQEHIVAGDWAFFGKAQNLGALIRRQSNLARLQLPLTPPKTYMVEIDVTRKAGNADLAIGLIYQGQPCHVVIDGWKGTACGVTAANNGRNMAVKEKRQPVLSTDQRSKIVCVVQADGFVVVCNDQEIVRFAGPPTWNGMNTGWRVPDATKLNLGAEKSIFIFHSYKLTPTAPGPLPANHAEHAPTGSASIINGNNSDNE